MKIRGEILSLTQRFEFENLKQVRKTFEQRRKRKNAEIYTLYRHIPQGPRRRGGGALPPPQ